MPKENKKFINPLLRPSQDVAPAQEKSVPEAEKSSPAAKRSVSVSPSTDVSLDDTPVSTPVEETTKAAEQLLAQAKNVDTLIGQFKIG